MICPACDTRFLLTPVDDPVLPLHHHSKIANPGRRGRPVWVQDLDNPCPSSGLPIGEAYIRIGEP